MSDRRISDAVIVHGPGRSGTTQCYNLLTLHPEAAWISGWNDRLPGLGAVALLSRVQSSPPVERWSRDRRYWPRPAEAYRFWDRYFPRFSEQSWERHLDQGRPEACVRALRSIAR